MSFYEDVIYRIQIVANNMPDKIKRKKIFIENDLPIIKNDIMNLVEYPHENTYHYSPSKFMRYSDHFEITKFLEEELAGFAISYDQRNKTFIISW